MCDGQFIISHPGKVLFGAVLSTSQRNEIDCESACLMDGRCKSINFNTNSGLGCQLNSKIVGDYNTDFIEKIGWTYKSTNFSAKQVRDARYVERKLICK